jgi:hypothetical protein
VVPEHRRGGGVRCLPVWLFVALVGLCGCEKGCARSWFQQHGVGGAPSASPGALLNAIDCPDGLARCVEGVVEVSRLATIPMPCAGRAGGCECPWEREGDCDRGCVASGANVVMERDRALRQLCVQAPDGGPAVRATLEPADCDDEVLYRCAGGAVVSCAQRAVIGRCDRGCAMEGGDIGVDVPVDREGAFAILCSR